MATQDGGGMMDSIRGSQQRKSDRGGCKQKCAGKDKVKGQLDQDSCQRGEPITVYQMLVFGLVFEWNGHLFWAVICHQ